MKDIIIMDNKNTEKFSIQLFSFFSGLGLLDLGFEDAGFQISSVDEVNNSFLRSYEYIRQGTGHNPKYGYSSRDIREYLSDDVWITTFGDYKSKKNLTGFIGGPPCPDFSTAGKNEGIAGSNGQLTEAYIQLIIKRKPDFFVFENVKGLYQTKKHRQYYDELKSRLKISGYCLFDSIENGLWYGVPQDRARLILIGLNSEIFGDNVKYQIGSNRIYSKEDIERANWPSESKFQEGSMMNCPKGVIKQLTVEYWFRKNNVYLHPNCNDIFHVKSKEKFYNIPEGHSNGKSFKRLHRWRYSPTAAYGNNEVHLHPYHARRLSVAEVLAIQSAPERIALPLDLPLSTKFKMVGNGVPYLLSYYIAKELFDWLVKWEKTNEY